jgi:hypothetical protein
VKGSIMDLDSIFIGDKIKYLRNKKVKVLKVSEIGRSYGSDKIFYKHDGGFCIGKEVIKKCRNKSKNMK